MYIYIYIHVNANIYSVPSKSFVFPPALSFLWHLSLFSLSQFHDIILLIKANKSIILEERFDSCGEQISELSYFTNLDLISLISAFLVCYQMNLIQSYFTIFFTNNSGLHSSHTSPEVIYK